MKECKECKNNYPADTDHYFKKCDMADGLTSRCKVCLGKKFTKKLQQQVGFKFCKKCDRQLLINIRFFPPDKACKDGLRNVCRECDGNGRFMDEEYDQNPKRVWSEEENALFIKLYPHHTNEELIELYYPKNTIK